MPRRSGGICASLAVAIAGTLVGLGAWAEEKPEHQWKVHDMDRPQPEVVDPGTASTPDEAGRAPSDAIVLFDGKDLSKWTSNKGPARWRVQDGYMEVAKKSGGMRTKESFGSCQLHVEWRAPSPPKGNSQGRGNSGVFLMGRYEVQVLDCFENKTYPDGQAGSVYGQSPPLVNACRKPGEWQTYDIIFHRPHFDARGKCVKPATLTLLQNGVLVQDHFELEGSTAHKRRASYRKHPDKLPLSLQDHGNPVRYRNIWIRPLED
ncbi:MAG: 3-keto-disaccharide hydrolase [Planctomycetota bacterium]